MGKNERLKIAILDDYEKVFTSHPALQSLQSRVDLTVFEQPLGSVENAANALQTFDGICLVRERQPFPAALIAGLPRLKHLVFTGARNPSCDAGAARERGITVSNTPGGPSKASTAELAWALALAAAKKLPAAVSGLKAGNWRADERGLAYGLPSLFEGKTLGLLGLGEIGQRVARFGQAFGMSVIAWSPNLTPERAAEHGVKAVSQEQLFMASNVLSVHLVLAPATRAVIGSAQLALMPADAILVNTSRAGLIDSQALAQGLSDNPARQVALDVFDSEPLQADDPLAALLNRPGSVMCPHLGYVNEPVFEAFAAGLAQVIASWCDGAPDRVINA